MAKTISMVLWFVYSCATFGYVIVFDDGRNGTKALGVYILVNTVVFRFWGREKTREPDE